MFWKIVVCLMNECRCTVSVDEYSSVFFAANAAATPSGWTDHPLLSRTAAHQPKSGAAKPFGCREKATTKAAVTSRGQSVVDPKMLTAKPCKVFQSAKTATLFVVFGLHWRGKSVRLPEVN
ncbi:MAG: hypothetical protein AB7E32_03965 [Desulfovibrio sp.]